MKELKELSVEDLLLELEGLNLLIGSKAKLQADIQELKYYVEQMVSVKKSINQLVNSNESLQNRIRMKDEEILMLTKEAQQIRRNESMLKESNSLLKGRIELLISKLMDIGLITRSVMPTEQQTQLLKKNSNPN